MANGLLVSVTCAMTWLPWDVTTRRPKVVGYVYPLCPIGVILDLVSLRIA